VSVWNGSFPNAVSLSTHRATYFHCDWTVAGTNGGGQTVVVKLRDLTAAGDICSCSLGACDGVAGTDVTCLCAGNGYGAPLTVSADDTYAIRLSTSTNCTVNPTNIECSLRIDPNVP
jgi:hypothetical protein